MGILSERDYIRKLVPKRIATWEVLVKDIMTENVICVARDDTIEACMELMCSNRLRHPPVTVGKSVIGMVSISDVVRALRSARIDFPPILITVTHVGRVAKEFPSW